MNKKNLIILGGILLVALFVRLVFLGKEAIWLDEAFSLFYAKGGGGGLFDVVWAVIEGKDSHPPFYYMLLSFWQFIFGNSLVMARFMSLLFGLLSIVAVYFFGKRMRDEKTGLSAAIILSLLVFAVLYSFEARMYSLLLFEMILSLWIFFSLGKGWTVKRLLAFSAVCALMLYTHYFAFFWLGFLFTYGLVQRLNWKWLLASAGTIFFFYLPWFSVLLSQLIMKFVGGGAENSLAWLDLPSPSYLIFKVLFEEFFYFQGLFGAYEWWALALVILFVLGLMVFSFFGEEKIWNKKLLYFFGLGFLFNLVLPYLISVFASPIIHPRYMQGAFLLTVLFLALLISQFRGKKFALIILIITVLLSSSLIRATRTNFHPDWYGLFKKHELVLAPKVLISPAYYKLPLRHLLEAFGYGHVAIETFNYQNANYREIFRYEFVLIERLPLPEVVAYLRENCEILEEDHFERVSYYRVYCQ